MFCIQKYVVCIRLVRNGSSLHQIVPTIQNIIYVDLFIIIVPNACVSGVDVLNYSKISFVCQFGSLVICFVKFRIVFYCWLTLKLFYIIYILVGINHVSMVIIPPLNGLGWRFSEIFSLEIIPCEPLLHQYT